MRNNITAHGIIIRFFFFFLIIRDHPNLLLRYFLKVTGTCKKFKRSYIHHVLQCCKWMLPSYIIYKVL